MKHTIFTPYRVCPLGAHVDHQLGQVTGFAIDRGVNLEFDITEDGTFDIISKNYPGHIMFTLEDELGKMAYYFLIHWMIPMRLYR